MTTNYPLRALALTYAMYFGALGISGPYLNPYLQDQGFSLSMIGTVSALMIAVRIVGQLLWSWLADITGRPVHIIRIAAALTCSLIFVGWILQSSPALIAVMLLWSLMLSACLPQIESITLSRLGTDKPRYGRIRLWGSIGFIISVVAVGYVLDFTGTDIVIPLMILVYAGLTVALMTVPIEHHSMASALSPSKEPVLTSIQRVWVLLLVCLLMQASHAPFYTFFSIHLKALNYSGLQIGALWAIGVVCEVAVFYLGARLLRSLGASWLLVLTFAAAAIRWTMLAMLADSPVWLTVSQCLHGLTFGACHAASIHLIHDRFPASSQHRGQAIFASVTYGCGTAVGTWISGLVWENWGAQVTLLGAAATAAIAMFIGAGWASRSKVASGDT